MWARRAVFGIGSPLTTGTPHRERGRGSRRASWWVYLRILEDRLAKIETAEKTSEVLPTPDVQVLGSSHSA